MSQAVANTAVSIEEEATKLYRQFLEAGVAIEASRPYDLAYTILLRSGGYSHPPKPRVMALRQHLIDGILTEAIECTRGRRIGANLYQPKSKPKAKSRSRVKR